MLSSLTIDGALASAAARFRHKTAAAATTGDAGVFLGGQQGTAFGQRTRAQAADRREGKSPAASDTFVLGAALRHRSPILAYASPRKPQYAKARARVTSRT